MRASHLRPDPSPVGRSLRICCSSPATTCSPPQAPGAPSPDPVPTAGRGICDRFEVQTVRLTRGGIMHGVIRRYRVRLGTVAQAARYTEKGFLPILRGIPGFVSSNFLTGGTTGLTG